MTFHEFIDQLLANSWRAGILIAALFAVRGVLRRFIDARVIYWFWVLVAVRLLLPFDVPVSASAASKGAALIIDIWPYGGSRTNPADGMGAPTSSLASLEWRPIRTSVFCSL